MKQKFKVGDRVKAIARVGCKFNTIGEVGTVVAVNKHSNKPLVEFDNDIEGHDGFDFEHGYRGKNGHCWWCVFDDITHVSQVNRVIYNNPATIILWNDGSKTVAKCMPGDTYDAEKGFLVAYLKKFVDGDTLREEMTKWVDAADTDDNKPLTNGELMKMDGQKVWLVSLNYDGRNEPFDSYYSGWHMVNAKEHRLYSNGTGYYFIKSNGSPYGFRAYRKPPKEVK